jgi:eukaryotic-like serine/threonine-protein kinase
VLGASTANSDDRGVLLWSAEDGTILHALKGHWGRVCSVAFSPDGRRLATAGEDRKVRIWDTASVHEVLTLDGHTDMVYSVAFSPDGRRLASAGAGTANGPEMIRLWEAP